MALRIDTSNGEKGALVLKRAGLLDTLPVYIC